MPYTPFHENWEDDPSVATPVTAAALEHIEAGVVEAQATAEDAASVVGLYDQWQYAPTTTTPAWGQVSTGAEAPADATSLYINVMSNGGRDYTGLLKLLSAGARIAVQNNDNTDSWVRYEATGDAVITAGVGTVPVQVLDAGSVAATGWTSVSILFTENQELPAEVVLSDDIDQIVVLTQTEYDAMTPPRPANVMYLRTPG